MLNSNQWLHQHNEFVNQAQAQLQRAQECVAHLEMIVDDEDAITCLQSALFSLADKATGVAQHTIAGFTGQLHHRLRLQFNGNGLNAEALNTLRHCLDLLAWQLELIDPHTGELALDDEEQHTLLSRFDI